jgi:hypothetical protein
MTVSLSFAGVEPARQLKLREVFHAHARRLTRRLDSDAPDLMRLEGRIEKEPGGNGLRVNLYFKFARGVFVVTREGPDAATLLQAFDELERRLSVRLARSRPFAVRHGLRVGTSAMAQRSTPFDRSAGN